MKDLSRYAKYYAAFIGKNNCYNYKISRYLEAFRDIDQSTLYPFLFDVFDDFEHNKINEQILLRVLSFFRSYSVRRIICEYSSNSLKGLYKTLYKRLFKEAVDYDKYYDVIYTFFKTTGTKDKLVSDDEFFEALIYKKLYTKKKACRFLLASLENENSNEQLKIDGLTIEHILPQKENAIIWKQALGEDYEKTYSTYLHTLGNLTITGYNSELGAKSFSDKKKIIMQFSKAKILNEAVLSAKVWNESAILNRAKALAGKTMEIFNIEKGELVEKAAISTAAQVFTFEDQDAVAGTEPKSFTFYGENISVKSYAKMLDSMIV